MRTVLTIASGTSAVLWVAVVAVWVRSYFAADFWDIARSNVTTSRGVALIRIDRSFSGDWDVSHSTALPYDSPTLEASMAFMFTDARIEFAGFGYGRLELTPYNSFHCLRLPLWAIAVLFAIPPVLWWWARSGHRRRVRIRKGLCPRCAYNLTGCTSPHCPECGEPVPASTSTS